MRPHGPELTELAYLARLVTNARGAEGCSSLRPPRGPVPTTDSSATEEEYRMSPQPQTPGANAEAAAARSEEAGSPPPSPAPDEQVQSATALPEAGAGTAPETAETTAAPTAPPAAAGSAEEPEEGAAAAVAVAAAPPDVKSGTGADTGRPRGPILAGAAIAGAVLVAIPLLLAGSANDERPDSAKGLAAGSDTVLNASSAPAVLDDYVAKKPSSSPSRKKPKKSTAPKVVAAPPAAPSPSVRPSKSPEKKPKAETKPKADPKPDWGTRTVYATSVLQTGQSWSTNRIRMIMQTDGNLVVYNEDNKAIWASMTFGANHRAIFQEDGNLVIHNGDDRPIWASRTHGHANAQLVLRADGKVVVLHNGGVIWST
ncbi:mannose-binding protein [Streptomyces sp. NPDC005551]|uniref:mannose-binding protein n=1 Tax=Streptomyces sp. NPDC005551 TaxID=3364725 RepID=UPI003680D295